MKILLDMNIPVIWESFLNDAGHQALHWSNIGDIRAADIDIMLWAREHSFIVFTHDLDFGALLFSTNAKSPSVIQLRTENIMPTAVGTIVLQTLDNIATELQAGVLVTIDPRKNRVRLLPLKG